MNPAPRRPSAGGWIGLGLAALVLFSLFIGLGVWQLQRRVWKLELIREVNQRVHAAPVAAPGPPLWPAVPAQWAYRRVWVHGAITPRRVTLTEAVTDLGPGYWVLAPLRADQGFSVLVNLGFAPADDPQAAYRTVLAQQAPVTVSGLVRLSEPHGGFLRANDPATGRWYSRDVAAIARADGLGDAAPYFIDADASAKRPGWPVGGLTVIRFPNSHLIYAITWFALAALTAGGFGLLVRERLRASD